MIYASTLPVVVSSVTCQPMSAFDTRLLLSLVQSVDEVEDVLASAFQMHSVIRLIISSTLPCLPLPKYSEGLV